MNLNHQNDYEGVELSNCSSILKSSQGVAPSNFDTGENSGKTGSLYCQNQVVFEELWAVYDFYNNHKITFSRLLRTYVVESVYHDPPMWV